MKCTFAPSLAALVAAGLIAQASSAATINVSERTPGGDSGGSGTRALETDLGSVAAPGALPTMTYTVSGLDLTSVGGTASETIVFDIDFTQTGGTGVQFNSFGNISVTNGAVASSGDNQVEPGETITATLSLNAATTFTGSISLGFTNFFAGGANASESWDVTTEGGTISRNGTQDFDTRFAAFAPSSFVTLGNVAYSGPANGVNIERYVVQIEAVPEPGSLALLGLGGLCLVRRRRA